MSADIPKQYQALVLTEVGQPMELARKDTPQAIEPGSVLLRVLIASVRANAPSVYRSQESGHPLPTPFTPGFIALGRVAKVGPDATSLHAGQLVLFDPYIQGRDDVEARFISGFMEGHTKGSLRLSRDQWRDSSYAEYVKAPLENCYSIDESHVCGSVSTGGLGYALEDLTHLFSMLIPFGGLADIDIKAGETVIIAPATSRYGSAAVHLALAMGARVIAIGRTTSVLQQLRNINTRVSTVQITGHTKRDTVSLLEAAHGPADAFWDMSPATATDSTHFQSCLESLKFGARISLMGSVQNHTLFPYLQIVFKALTIKGTTMCTREQGLRLIKLLETGALVLGPKAGMGPVRTFSLIEWDRALDAASQHKEPGEIVLVP